LIKIKSLQVFPTWQYVSPNELSNKVAVVIDVLRASNTVINALNNEAKEIIPVSEIDIAWDFKNKHPAYLLGGERNSQKIEGFDFGNSPLEYTSEKIKSKGIILTTSNGSKALKTTEKADHSFVASLANGKAIAHLLDSFNLDIAIVCAGTLGNPSLEDTLAAGKIIAEMNNIEDYRLNDYAYISLGTFQYYKSDIYNSISKSRNGRRLKDLEMEDDIKYCSKIDTTIIVPEFIKGKIIKTDYFGINYE